jgi:hypothetical protein
LAIQGGPLPDPAAVFFNQSYISKFPAGDGGSFLSGYAARNEFLDLFVEVLLNLVGELIVQAAAREQLL